MRTSLPIFVAIVTGCADPATQPQHGEPEPCDAGDDVDVAAENYEMRIWVNVAFGIAGLHGTTLVIPKDGVTLPATRTIAAGGVTYTLAATDITTYPDQFRLRKAATGTCADAAANCADRAYIFNLQSMGGVLGLGGMTHNDQRVHVSDPIQQQALDANCTDWATRAGLAMDGRDVSLTDVDKYGEGYLPWTNGITYRLGDSNRAIQDGIMTMDPTLLPGMVTDDPPMTSINTILRNAAGDLPHDQAIGYLGWNNASLASRMPATQDFAQQGRGVEAFMSGFKCDPMQQQGGPQRDYCLTETDGTLTDFLATQRPGNGLACAPFVQYGISDCDGECALLDLIGGTCAPNAAGAQCRCNDGTLFTP